MIDNFSAHGKFTPINVTPHTKEESMSNLPPRPYTYYINQLAGKKPGNGHVYILDANGRKILAVWGKPAEKIALAEMIYAGSKL